MIRIAHRFVPSLEAGDVEQGPWAVRAQLIGGDGRLIDDFRIHRNGRVQHVLNAPSPAATALLSIGAHSLDEVLPMLD
jgi:(S)-2-hydroxyglutarate dehydrogenase